MRKRYYLIQKDRVGMDRRKGSDLRAVMASKDVIMIRLWAALRPRFQVLWRAAEECSCSSIDERAQCTQVEQQANALLYPKDHYKDPCASLRPARCSLIIEHYKHSQAHTIMGHPHLDIER